MIISVPVWGRPYLKLFAHHAAPALLHARDELWTRRGVPARFLVHTTRADEATARAALPGAPVEAKYISNHPTYEALQSAHSEAVRAAAVGEHVVLLNADLVVSGNFLDACEGHLASGACAVVLLGIRTAIGADKPPVGAAPRALLRWAWDHRHQIIRDLEVPSGASLLPTNLFFTAGSSTVARGFHLHPAAITKREDTSFRSTIDGDLLDCFPRELVHVVQSPDDCAMLEMSPPERRFPVRAGGSLSPNGVAASMRGRASATHCWLLTHRIGVVGGDADCGDDAFVRATLEIMAREPVRVPSKRLGRQPGGRRGRYIPKGAW